MSSFHVHIPLSFHDVILNSLGYVFKEFLKKKTGKQCHHLLNILIKYPHFLASRNTFHHRRYISHLLYHVSFIILAQYITYGEILNYRNRDKSANMRNSWRKKKTTPDTFISSPACTIAPALNPILMECCWSMISLNPFF